MLDAPTRVMATSDRHWNSRSRNAGSAISSTDPAESGRPSASRPLVSGSKSGSDSAASPAVSLRLNANNHRELFVSETCTDRETQVAPSEGWVCVCSTPTVASHESSWVSVFVPGERLAGARIIECPDEVSGSLQGEEDIVALGGGVGAFVVLLERRDAGRHQEAVA